MVAQHVTYDLSAHLCEKRYKARAAQTHARVTAFEQRTLKRKVVVVGVGYVFGVHVHQCNLLLNVRRLGRMYVTVVYGYVSALVTQVYHTRISEVFGTYFQRFERGIVGSVDGYDAVIVGHLVGVVAAFAEMVVIDMHVATLSRCSS